MIEVRDEETTELKIGDIVCNNAKRKEDQKFFIVQRFKRTDGALLYCLKDIYDATDSVNMAEESLKQLRTRALTIGYVIYSQDKYKLVIERR